MVKTALLTNILLILALSFSPAQERYALKTFTTRDGLPHNQVLSIAQDSTGFIWIATWDGLSRFDGYEFKNYYHNPDDPASLPYFSVQKIIIDRFGKMWVNPSYGSTVQYSPPSDNYKVIESGKRKQPPALIEKDYTGSLWKFTASESLYRYDYQTKQFAIVKLFDKQNREVNFDRFYTHPYNFDNKGNLWIYFEESDSIKFLFGSPYAKGFVMSIFSKGKPVKPVSGYNVMSPFMQLLPYISLSGRAYIFSNKGLFLVDLKKGKLSLVNNPLPLNDFQGNFSHLWSSDSVTVSFYDPTTGRFESISDNSKAWVNFMFRDREGNLWISKMKKTGEGDGLKLFTPITPFFRHYLGDKDTNSNNNAFFAVMKDRYGTVWAAARNQNFLYRIEKDHSISKVNFLHEKIWKKAMHLRSFLEDSTGIWMGYYRNLLMYYDYSVRKFTVKYFEHHLSNEYENVIGFENLISTEYGLTGNSSSNIFNFDIQKNILFPVRVFKDDSIKSTLYKLIRLPDSCFVATANYGNTIYLDKNFREKARWILGNGIFNVEDACPGERNDLWLALLGGGLAHLDITTGKSETFTTAEGLSNNTCYRILKDQHGNLWISTNHGISRFNPNTRRFRTFDASDGLHIDEFNSDAAYQAPDGEMFFGGMGDIVSFYPDSLKETNSNEKPARLIITDFKVSGITRYFEKAVYEMDTVSLSKGDNNFQVTYACLDFQNPEKIRYRYRLSGQKSGWTETDFRHRFVNFANLTPGKYPLEIEAANRNGDWVSGTSLLIMIPPFFYQTFWFRLLIIAGFILLTGYFVYSYNYRIRLKARREQEQLKLESLRGQMNPHFIFNSLNSINYFIAGNDRLSANRYIADFSRLIRSILGNLSKEYVPFSKEVESLQDYLKLEYLRFGDKFEYSIGLPPENETADMQVFPGMVQPFVENAIWHGVRGLEGRKGFVRIRFTLTGHLLRCTVEDDGIGRRLAEERKSLIPGKTSKGIGIVLERLRIINNLKKAGYQVVIGDLFPEKIESGTRVIIDIPVKL